MMDALRRPTLAPLEPDAFLAWAWRQGDRAKGTSPLTVEDIHFELSRGEERPGLSLEELCRSYVRIAALVRRNQRLGLEPFAGIL